VVFSINKTDHHDITEILLEVALNTITPSINYYLVRTTFLPKICFGMTLFLNFFQIYNKIYFHTSVFASVED
jgi:hypothetical protein